MAALTLASSCALAAATAPPAAASRAAPASPAAPASVAAPASRAQVSPALDTVAVDSLDYRAAATRYNTAAAALSTAQQIASNSASELDQLQLQDTSLTTQLATQTEQKKQATVDLASARASLRAIAIESYVNGTTTDSTDTEDLATATETLDKQGLTQTVSAGQADKAASARDDLDRLTKSMNDVLTQRTAVRQQSVEAQQSQQQAAADEARYSAAVAQAQVDLEQTRVTATVLGADFQLVAFDAYRRAAASSAATDPGCGIPWWALAGITRVESKHGQFGGSTLLFNGDTSQRIVGIPLDGQNDTQAIPDSDGGALDGDPVYDRAVGPMQFIPSTWRRYARDGNGDGVADPNNIYDAAAAAARYLCASGPMQTDDDMTRGFLSYNHSDAYAAEVLSFAKAYAALGLPS
ncbi:MAG TPA: lytic transglycosylase domain-containing protein [Acidimicrobiales bacterium]